METFEELKKIHATSTPAIYTYRHSNKYLVLNYNEYSNIMVQLLCSIVSYSFSVCRFKIDEWVVIMVLINTSRTLES